MEVENNQVVQNSSEGSNGAGASTAGSSTTVSAAGNTPLATSVVARMGFRLALQEMLQGWQTVIPGDSTVVSSAGNLAPADVMARLQGYLGAYAALDTAATAYKQARGPVGSQQLEARQYFAVLKAALANLLGPQSPKLEQFGLRPGRTRRALTSSQLSVKVAKAEATRGLRGTIGPKKKAQIKAGSMQFVKPVAAPSSGPADGTAATTAPSTTTGK